ncbi:diguanylate cyclase [Litoreibacter arenae]|uniref:diguanylate cyclase n=1 Tax=Litoreibacter arenae DSM 19593 TaxID=1123360 RepID=S9QM21_9RHOB|nr:diguanylate cyclase [Litoreibacter arenae]EPX80802.1 GGDEF domain protein [Litoreibacter arenae DSM 19593]
MAGRVLILDPVPTNRMVLKAKLGHAHYDVCVADNVEQARSMAKTQIFEAVLISTALLSKPAGCVLKWLRETRAEAVVRSTVVFMQDGRSDEHGIVDLQRCLDAGADDVLIRPFSEEVLLARLRNLMRENAVISEINGLNLPNSCDTRKENTSRSSTAKVVVAQVGQSSQYDLISDAQNRLDQWNELCQQTFYAEAASLSVLTQADAIAREPDIVLLVAETGAAERALSIMSQMRSRSRMRDVRVILMLKEPRAAQVARAFDLGAHDVVSQDVTPLELVSRINKQCFVQGAIQRTKQVVHDSLLQAVTDPLTGLYNRRFAATKLAQMKADSLASGERFAVLAFDVDHFKEVNDRHGHAIGDAVLTTLADTLKRNLRDDDLICRTGGEEFLVALPKTNDEEATATANRLRKAVGELDIQVHKNDVKLRVTVSVGLSVQNGQMAISDMLEQADRGLYLAKARGRNAVAVAAAA